MYSSPHPSVHLLSLLFLPPMRTHPITRENPSLLNPYTSTSTSTSTSGAGYISRLLSWEIFPDWAFFLFLTPFCRREGRKEGPGRRAKRTEGVCLNCSYKSSCFGTSRQLDRCRQNSRETWRQRERQNDTPRLPATPSLLFGHKFFISLDIVSGTLSLSALVLAPVFVTFSVIFPCERYPVRRST